MPMLTARLSPPVLSRVDRRVLLLQPPARPRRRRRRRRRRSLTWCWRRRCRIIANPLFAWLDRRCRAKPGAATTPACRCIPVPEDIGGHAIVVGHATVGVNFLTVRCRERGRLLVLGRRPTTTRRGRAHGRACHRAAAPPLTPSRGAAPATSRRRRSCHPGRRWKPARSPRASRRSNPAISVLALRATGRKPEVKHLPERTARTPRCRAEREAGSAWLAWTW